MSMGSGSSLSSLSHLSSLGPAASGLSGVATLPSVPVLGKGAKAARAFEAQLIGTVLQSLEKTFADLPGEAAVAGSDDYNYMGTQALATALAAGGGFGIARLITQHFADIDGRTKG